MTLRIYDTDAAIGGLNQEIDRCPSDEELKLRRSILGLELDRTDLIDQDPLGVPTPDRVIPEIACDAVRVLREIGHAEYTVNGNGATVNERRHAPEFKLRHYQAAGARSLQGDELMRPHGETFKATDPLGERALILCGVTMRKYDRSLETLHEGLRSSGTNR